MRNIKLEIEYKGDQYFGFQKQKDKKTVQGEITKYLEELLLEKIYIIASGRTDKGVHAISQIINFKTNSKIENFKILKYLNRKFEKTNNKYLKVKSIQDVDLSFNSNLDAKEKTYLYIINNSYESALFNDFEYTYIKKLNIQDMKKAVNFFIGEKDFKAFCNSDNETATTVRTIKKFNMKEKNGKIIFEITADGFLNKMVRIIIGTILDIGIGKINVEDLEIILNSKNRKKAGRTIPAKGLFLKNIKY